MDWWTRSKWLQSGTLLALKADNVLRFAEVVRRNVKQLAQPRAVVGVRFCDTDDLREVLLDLSRREAAARAAKAKAEKAEKAAAQRKAAAAAAGTDGAGGGARAGVGPGAFAVLQTAGAAKRGPASRRLMCSVQADAEAAQAAAAAAALQRQTQASGSAAGDGVSALTALAYPAAAEQAQLEDAPPAAAPARPPQMPACWLSPTPPAHPPPPLPAGPAPPLEPPPPVAPHAPEQQSYDAVQVSSDFFVATPILERLQQIDNPPFAQELFLSKPPEGVDQPHWRADRAAARFLFDELDEFDAAQRRAFEHALSHRVALIQGPPGTGKTRIGVAIARALLTDAPGKPARAMLVVCHTNHALDQFLEVRPLRDHCNHHRQAAALRCAELRALTSLLWAAVAYGLRIKMMSIRSGRCRSNCSKATCA